MKDRTISRGQGCWNCVHKIDAKEFWTKKRQDDLQVLLGYANQSPLGENDPRVKNGRRMIDMFDHGVAQKALIHCKTGRTAINEPVGDLTPANYLCSKWSGADGASIAREGKTDKLPEELLDESSMTLTQFVNSQKNSGGRIE